MNGPIAQLVALTCYGNSFVKGEKRIPFFPGNSTCKFCDSITYSETKNGIFGRKKEITVAESPDSWFNLLQNSGAAGIRLLNRPQNRSGFPDRMSAGFVGGGGEWALEVVFSESSKYWYADWEVWNQQAPDNRIWRVKYRVVNTRWRLDQNEVSLLSLKTKFRSILNDIHEFSNDHNLSGFSTVFRKAIQSVDEERVIHGYHKDLYIPDSVSNLAASLLDAAQSAWVFGGMGSWNDLGFDGEEQKRYEKVSEMLFTTLIQIICSASNDSFKK